MNVRSTTLKYICGSLLLGAAASSVAVSLGRLRGVAIIGRAFDGSVVAQITAPETASSLCIEADVYYGDSKLSPDRVKLAVNPGSASSEATVRIQTTLPVDEPIVTVYFREGCSQKTTRKYVLLSEVLAEQPNQLPSTFPEILAGTTGAAGARPALGGGAAGGSGMSGTSGGSGTSGMSAGSGASASSAASSAASRRNPGRTSSPGRPAVNAAAPATRPARASGSRLKLDPIELGPERDPVLRSSPTLITTPTEDAQRRADASALWQALNAQPQDILRNNERLKALETDVAKALAQSRRNDTSVAELRTQLEEARSERYNNWVIYGLLGLIPLSLLLAFFLWNERRRKDEDDDGGWWRKGDADVAAADAEQAAALDAGATSSHVKTAALDAATAAAGDDATLPGRSRSGSASRSESKSRTAPDSTSGFQNSMSSVGGSSRVVNAEELFDVQQQADFFLSLGNADKAVEVLRHHISENVDTSAMAYLDLFELYHSLERRDDYEALRKEFNQVFNAQVPAYDEYATATHGLEYYTSALSRIESLWGTPKVLDVIEESIFRKPGSGEEAFSLAAYRELLLLHAIAKRISSDRQGATEPALLKEQKSPRTGFAPTSIQPLSAEMRESTPMDLTRPPASPRLGLDIDLTEAFEPEEPAFILPPSPAIAAMEPSDSTGFHNTIPPEQLLPPLPEVHESFRAESAKSPSPSLDDNMIEFELDPIEPADKRKKK